MPAVQGFAHMALSVTNSKRSFRFEHSGIQSDAAGLHLNARDPDHIAIEFYAPPS